MSAAPAPEQDDKKPTDKPAEPVKASADPTEMAAPAADAAAAEESAESPTEEASESNADAYVSSLADTTGQSKDAVLAILMDKIDDVAAIITANAGDGTASSAGKPMTATSGKRDANVIELKHLQRKNIELTQRLEVIEKREAASVAKAQKAIVEEKVKALVASGHVHDGDEAFGDAVYMFTTDAKRAERVYGRRVTPIGGTVAGDDPNATNASVDAITLDGMTDAEQRQVVQLSRLVPSEEAEQIVALMRGGKMDAATAHKKVAAKRSKKEAR